MESSMGSETTTAEDDEDVEAEALETCIADDVDDEDSEREASMGDFEALDEVVEGAAGDLEKSRRD